MLSFAALLVLQWVEPKPSHTDAGETVVIEARTAEGAPIADLPIEVRWPDGRVESIGETDADGNRSFVVSEVGAYRVAARYEGVDLLAPLHARPTTSRVWYAIVCVPLGLLLLWRNLRRR